MIKRSVAQAARSLWVCKPQIRYLVTSEDAALQALSEFVRVGSDAANPPDWLLAGQPRRRSLSAPSS
jgi:hypothetical protein